MVNGAITDRCTFFKKPAGGEIGITLIVMDIGFRAGMKAEKSGGVVEGEGRY